MRQKFDIGDIVLVDPPVDQPGVVVDTKYLHAAFVEQHPQPFQWHHDEYSCKIKFFHTSETKWVRAKLLSHLSKITE